MPEQTEVTLALNTIWDSIAEFSAGMEEPDWAQPTECPGWSVKDNLIHMIGTERILLGEDIPDVEIEEAPHIKNEIGRINERWIYSRKDKPGSELLEEFKEVTSARKNYLAELTPENWDAAGPTPIGEAPYSRFMQIRAMDCWLHEQDMREALSQPGHREGLGIKVTLDEILPTFGYIVGKKGGAPEGSTTEFDLSGPEARRILVQIKDGRGMLAEPAETDSSIKPDIKFEASTFLITRLLGGRRTGQSALDAGEVKITSSPDFQETAQKILDNMGYMI